ncbi:hypothetical protein [Nostoc sp. 'Lobaria pulmonaria (5183) cyanobiont']|uniref:hypothetical protein n=1 Tax=Nostoc sp. 'Lobaria pulmonaria (5183) cyanobiont' TaxID=1618022 RepID=UPI000CF36167|nr:hypothetical protein [Nostoc sp. 'Lobaria pulmonaria (5183) cyanobiont']AVH71355.1 hypothetical protein NLP_2714 [Nostoc sp. 'Lobaria pulmonaria (5183) cyanobiont']
MTLFKWSRLIGLICTLGIVLYGWIGLSQSPQPSVRLTTNPPINQVQPLEAEATTVLGSGHYNPPVQLMLQAVDAQGQSLKDAKIHLQLFTPSKNPWFTTDFPIVEGTKLLDIEGNAPTGQLQVQQTLPIRGTYQLQVAVTPLVANAFQPIQQTLTLTLPENPLKFRYFGILVVILLAVGLLGGWVIGGRQPIQPGEIAPQQVRLLLSGLVVVAIAALLWVNINAELAESHHTMSMPGMGEEVAPSSKPAKLQSQGLDMQLSGDEGATVGQPARLQVSVSDPKTSQPVTDVVFKVTTTQLENNWLAFAYQGTPDSNGKLAWEQEFFDGAPHSIVVEVAPLANATRQFQPFQVAENIPVEGVAPPMSVRLISLTYFTGIVVIGLLLGLWLRHRQTPRTGLTWRRSVS